MKTQTSKTLALQALTGIESNTGSELPPLQNPVDISELAGRIEQAGQSLSNLLGLIKHNCTLHAVDTEEAELNAEMLKDAYKQRQLLGLLQSALHAIAAHQSTLLGVGMQIDDQTRFRWAAEYGQTARQYFHKYKNMVEHYRTLKNRF